MDSTKFFKKFYGSKKVLVCGGAGFIGSNLILALISAGAKIRSTYHTKKPQIKNSKIDYIKVDLTKGEDCRRAVKGIDYVFMCAANTSGAAVIEKNPLVHVTPNVIMNTLMLEASYEVKVKKFLFISSNTVYPPFGHPVKEKEAWNGEPFEKYFPVAWMKRFGEIMCEIYSTKIRSPMSTIVVRPANAFGPFDDFEWETSHVVPALIRKVVERQNPIEVWGDGKEIKDLIYVEDLVDGMLLAMIKINNFCPINIGTGIAVTIREVVDTILKVDGFSDARIVFNKSKPTMIPKRLINVGLAKRILGFYAKTSLSEGVRKTIEWYRNERRL